ncbi:MAG: PrsW family intramembrane metalloprotease, partial [Candidatus Pacebacteria bacterium]|nr:PrsW family intramembrane metalloprotease [Candidatus Paceibacterota bacterium]
GQIIQLDLRVVLFSLVGGILPALLWLWFWLKEDAKKPEPGSLILVAFLGGMIAVPFTIPFEQAIISIADSIKHGPASLLTHGQIEAGVIILWAFIEEVIKFIAIYFVAFKSRFFDEPIDALIYLITGALGFAALENSLYLMGSLVDGGVIVGAINTHLRFLGATLLHIVSSSAIGLAIAFSFYKKKFRFLYLIGGIVAATALHAIFNLFIIRTQDVIETIVVFSYYWVIVLVLIVLFEGVKLLRPLAKGTIRLK